MLVKKYRVICMCNVLACLLSITSCCRSSISSLVSTNLFFSILLILCGLTDHWFRRSVDWALCVFQVSCSPISRASYDICCAVTSPCFFVLFSRGGTGMSNATAADESSGAATSVSAQEEREKMWVRSCFLTRLVASSVRVSEAAGGVIKGIMCGGDLKIVDKGGNGKQPELQTEADRAAQYCIVHSLHKVFGDKLTIIGEEEVISSCSLEDGFSADVLKLDAQCSDELRSIRPEDVVIWVDPLDGTTEVATAASKNGSLMEQVTVLIGIAYKGRPIAGVIHQPYYPGHEHGRTIWSIKGLGTHGIDFARSGTSKVIVTTRSHSTATVTEALEALKARGLADSVERVGGAGYKVIKLLEGAAAYVFASAGCKKWDTAACEAIIEGAGGRMTDISGRDLQYHKEVQLNNTGGVLVTAPWVDHQAYLDSIPQLLKESLPEFQAKN